MNDLETARKLCEHAYLKHCDEHAKGTGPAFSLEDYWERNKDYFLDRAKIYFEVKECLEE